MTTCSGILAWKIQWTEELGGLHSPWGCKELEMIEHVCILIRTHVHTHTLLDMTSLVFCSFLNFLVLQNISFPDLESSSILRSPDSFQ